jgi:Zn-dependent M28 family amino/carboxypeptidase
MSAGNASEITAQALRAHVEFVAGSVGEHNVYHPAALAAVADYIERQWIAQGYAVGRETYPVEGVECANLSTELRGTLHPERIILLGAHYDSVRGCPGANDNGSGVAALLEISRCLAVTQPAATLRFVAFVNEEPPFFTTDEMGSMVCARNARKRGDDIRLMISLETIGYFRSEAGSQKYPPLFGWFYPNRGDFLAFVSNLRSRPMMRRAFKAFRHNSSFPSEHVATFSSVPGVSWSDHASFWRHGYPAIMVTDTALFRYPYYHTPEDTPDKLTYDPFAAVSNGLCRMFAELADTL